MKRRAISLLSAMRRSTPLRLPVVPFMCVLLGMTDQAAPILVRVGEPPPEIDLRTIDDNPFVLSEQRGRTTVLVFGELYNENTLAACADLQEFLREPPADPVGVGVYLVVSQRVPVQELRDTARSCGVSIPIVHDLDREAMGRYQVRVMPSVVVVDPAGDASFVCSGYPIDFVDMIVDAVYLAEGKLSEAQYQQRRNAASRPAESPGHERAVRLTLLGQQLVRRGSLALAQRSFRDAIDIDPVYVPARVALADALLAQEDLVAAEAQYREALRVVPGSLDATLGLIGIEVSRGGEELETARHRLSRLAEAHPRDPRIAYLMGLVAERMNDNDAALGHSLCTDG
jgi:tetratricopeptide (TPR) repeat protein